MKKTIINAPESALYISDFMTVLPQGILNKAETGVGGTHIALQAETGKYIIAAPFTAMISQKCNDNKNVFGIYAGVKKSDFQEYINNGGNKVMVTYDSLIKVTSWLKEFEQDVYNDWKLLIDEYHLALTEYSYRNVAITNMLNESVKFNYVTYMSATPLEEAFTPKMLKDVDYTYIKWVSKKVKPVRRKTTKPYALAANIIRAYKAGKAIVNGIKSEEAFFFVNSVKSIKDLIDNTGLLPSQVKIVCADNPSNREVLGNYEINKVEDDNKPFTFITSLGFLGCDFHSETGIIYIVSSVGNKNTLLDIATSINQIVGRIRTKTNPFRNIFYHIFNTGATDMNAEEFEQYIQAGIKEAELLIEDLNNKPEDTRAIFAKRLNDKLEDSFFAVNESGMFELDEMKIQNAKWRYSIVNEIYTNGASVREAYLKAGFDVTIAQTWENNVDEFLMNATKTNWAEQLTNYCSAKDAGNEEEALNWLAYDKEFENIYNVLGSKKCNTLDYSKVQIKQALFESSDLVTDSVKQRLVNVLKSGEFYTSEYLKDLIGSIYKEFSVTKTAKATLMEEFFGAVKCSKRIEGIKKAGYEMPNIKRKAFSFGK